MPTFFLAPRLFPRFAQAVCDAIDSEGGPGILEFFEMDQKTKLASCLFASPSGTVAPDGLITFKLKEAAQVIWHGEVAWAKAVTAKGNLIFECDVGKKGTGKKPRAVILLDDVIVRKGDKIKLSNFTLRLIQTQES